MAMCPFQRVNKLSNITRYVSRVLLYLSFIIIEGVVKNQATKAAVFPIFSEYNILGVRPFHCLGHKDEITRAMKFTKPNYDGFLLTFNNALLYKFIYKYSGTGSNTLIYLKVFCFQLII